MDRRHVLKLLGAGGCGMAGIIASRALYRRAATRRSGEPKRPFALFDVDCRELNKTGNGWDFRARVAPLTDSLKRLYALAEQRQTPMVLTTCCSGRMLRPESLPEVLFVPMDAAQQQWRERVEAHRLFYLEKNRKYDMFAYNGNAARLVQALDVGEWVVFGNGFDLCIYSDVCGLLAAGQNVCLLSDVYVRGAPGYFVTTSQGRFATATAESQAGILAEFQQLGVRMSTLEQFLASLC